MIIRRKLFPQVKRRFSMRGLVRGANSSNCVEALPHPMAVSASATIRFGSGETLGLAASGVAEFIRARAIRAAAAKAV